MKHEIWHRAKCALATRLARTRAVRQMPNRLGIPLVSFSFDDFPHSAISEGARILGHYSVKATYSCQDPEWGANSIPCSSFWTAISRSCAARGHEVGCHSYSHARLSELEPHAIAQDLDRNREFLARNGVPPPVCFAYPYGDVNVTAKKTLSQRFLACRGIDGGVNCNAMDFALLKATILKRATQRDEITRLLNQAQECNGWVIFFTHDLSDEPSEYGCTPSLLRCALEAALDRGIQALTVGEVAQRICAETFS